MLICARFGGPPDNTNSTTPSSAVFFWLLRGKCHLSAGLTGCCCLLVVERLCGMQILSQGGFVCWLVACLTSQQQASVSQGPICSDNFTCCHTEIEVADPTFYLTQSQYTDTGPTSPNADPITPGAWQGSHWSANFEVTGMTRPRKNPGASSQGGICLSIVRAVSLRQGLRVKLAISSSHSVRLEITVPAGWALNTNN